MAFSEKVDVSVSGMQDDGVIFVKVVTTILKDGEPFGSAVIQKTPVNPGDDLTNQPNVVKAAAAILWTPEVLSAWARKKAEDIARQEAQAEYVRQENQRLAELKAARLASASEG